MASKDIAKALNRVPSGTYSVDPNALREARKGVPKGEYNRG